MSFSHGFQKQASLAGLAGNIAGKASRAMQSSKQMVQRAGEAAKNVSQNAKSNFIEGFRRGKGKDGIGSALAMREAEQNAAKSLGEANAERLKAGKPALSSSEAYPVMAPHADQVPALQAKHRKAVLDRKAKMDAARAAAAKQQAPAAPAPTAPAPAPVPPAPVPATPAPAAPAPATPAAPANPAEAAKQKKPSWAARHPILAGVGTYGAMQMAFGGGEKQQQPPPVVYGNNQYY